MYMYERESFLNFFLGGGIRIRHAWLLRGVLGTLAASEKADCMNIIGFVVSSIHFSITVLFGK